MRIAHVVHGFDTGGMEKGVATIIGNAAPEFDHVVVCLAKSGASAKLLPKGTPVVELNKRPGHSLLFYLRLARELKSLRPDIVHTRNWGGMDGVIACRIAGIRGVVHGEHGWGMDDPYGQMPRRTRARRFLSRWVREFTCVSRTIEQWLGAIVGPGVPVTQIYNGVDTDRFSPSMTRGEVRKELGIEEGAFVVTICGRLDPIKDHLTLFRAVEAVRARGVAIRLLVIGDGPERPRLERAVGPGIDLLGNREDVPRILGDTDVFALTSLNEGISNTILEAMASGLPVVATDVGGNPELVDDGVTGVLVSPGAPESIADALIEYWQDRDLRSAHGEAGRQRALRDFSTSAMVEGYEAVYRRHCGRTPTAP